MAEPTGELTRSAEDFWTDGACLVRGALDAATVETLRAAVDGLGDELVDLGALAEPSRTGGFRAGVDHWRGNRMFLEVATRGPLPRIVADILGTDRLWFYEDSVLVKEPGADVITRWHTDDGYFHVEGRQLATLWLALDRSPGRSGALRFVRGSHDSDERYRPTLFVTDDPIPGTAGVVPPRHRLDDPVTFGFDLEAGDVTIHHARTLHASRGNSGATPRRALSIRYCGDDTVVVPKPGAPSKPGLGSVEPGTSLADAADRLGLPEATLER